MILAALLVQALAAAAPAAAPHPFPQDADRLAACLASVDENAEAAYESARAWAAEGRRPAALVCAALADVARGRPEAGARQLEAVAAAAPEGARAGLYLQAGNAWLLAEAPRQAIAALDQAVRLAPKEADILIDRARAFALAGEWRRAEEDLSAAIDANPQQPLAFRLRAETRLRQEAYGLAFRDAERAVALGPNDPENQLMLGRVREAQRLANASSERPAAQSGP